MSDAADALIAVMFGTFSVTSDGEILIIDVLIAVTFDSLSVTSDRILMLVVVSAIGVDMLSGEDVNVLAVGMTDLAFILIARAEESALFC